MNTKRYYELVDNETQSIKVGRAKRGSKTERDQAKELYELLRTYTYHLIGMGNVFRRIARDFSGSDGSNWRNNRFLQTKRLKDLAEKLYSMSPYDTDAILKVENELEKIVYELSKTA